MSPPDPARLRAIVEEAIDQADPIGLLEIGCPDDEYAPEVDRVLAHVLESSDPESLRQAPFDKLRTSLRRGSGHYIQLA